MLSTGVAEVGLLSASEHSIIPRSGTESCDTMPMSDNVNSQCTYYMLLQLCHERDRGGGGALRIP